jgi:glycogen debranching enzyme
MARLKKPLRDLRGLVPDLKSYLAPDEKIIEVKKHAIKLPPKVTDYHRVLSHLGNVKNVEDLGSKGPLMASIALQGNKSIQALRKYEVVFGRDSLYMADHLLLEFPELSKVTLLYLASFQGTETNQYREEEFGRIPHEIRFDTDPIAKNLTKELGWQWPYYATIDATILFIRLLYRYVTEIPDGKDILHEKYKNRKGKEQTLQDALSNAVVWLLARMDANPQGFIESKAAFPGSHIVQSLQDSHTGSSIFDEKGELANPKQGIIPIEVQGQAYDALLNAAVLMDNTYLVRRAKKLKEEIFKLWLKEGNGGYFPVGADRDSGGTIRILRVKKGIAGFLLNTELFNFKSKKERTMVENFIEVLFSKELLAPGGIRGLATNAPRFVPTTYHNGTTWPVITFEIARGLRRQGYHALAKNLEERIMKIVSVTHLYPEYVRSDAQKPIRICTRTVLAFNTTTEEERKLEVPPQLFQGWTVSAVANILFRRQAKLNPEDSPRYKPKPFERKILSRIKNI